jgi:dCTP deaminase
VILSDQGIKEALRNGAIKIDPLPEDDHFDPSSLDLLLGDDFQMWDRKRLGQGGAEITLNLALQKFPETAENYLVDAPLTEGCLLIPPYSEHPWHFLCQTRSRIRLDREHRIAARVEGKSSLARLGLLVHLTAPTIHTTFRGRITLEVVNLGPFYIKLVPDKTRICSIIFERVETEAAAELGSAFQDQTRPGGTH